MIEEEGKTTRTIGPNTAPQVHLPDQSQKLKYGPVRESSVVNNQGSQHELDGMVQHPRKTKLDTRSIDHRTDLVNPLPDNCRQFWVRVRVGSPA